uniref:EamA family transporter n=1 Tax=Ningiella ruwaisensis TaxID=2364274 RepID=UPI0010A07A5F|nr:EamA family transporter [Ningiella ruwaisensis]
MKHQANEFFAFAPMLTMVLAWWILGQVPNIYQVAGVIPILIDSYLITRQQQVTSKT